MGRLDGKVALITGAARGQGRSHALTLAREGADILALDVPGEIPGLQYELGYTTATAEQLDQLVVDIEKLDRRVIARRGDVRNQADLDALVADGLTEFGKIDILVANAGVSSVGRFWELSEEAWKQILDIDLMGVWRSTKAVVPHMIEQGHGSMVLISSVSGLEALELMGHYAAAKHGVIGLMRTAAVELGPYNIRVNCVCPGVVETDIVLWQGVYDMVTGGPGGTKEALRDAIRHWHLLGDQEMMDPSVISNAVLFLASSEAEKITGVALPVDSGHMALMGFKP